MAINLTKTEEQLTNEVMGKINLSKDKETATKVGQRHGKLVLYVVKAADMYRDGYKFYLSKNGVWLTKEVPAKYLVKQ